MRVKGQIISMILLFIFGLNMMDDLASHVEERPDQMISGFVSTEESEEIRPSLANSTDLSKPKESAPPVCDEPCHLGQCHLGHCAHLVVTGYSNAIPNPLITLTGLRNILAPKAPILEGLKRPPRLS